MKVLLIAWILTPLSAAQATDWREDARRFTGESAKVREQAISRLRKREGLATEMDRALGTRDQFLAFDVISALRMRELLPRLLRFSAEDASGYSYHVINSLLEAQDIPEVLRLYRERLHASTTSLAARVTLIDSLSRTRESLPMKNVFRLLRDESPEVRGATLAYVRKRILDWRQYEFLSAVLLGLRDARRPIRMQALYLVGELPDEAHARAPELHTEAGKQCRVGGPAEKESICESFTDASQKKGGANGARE